MNRGTALANAPTMPDGTFTLSVPPYNGALELVAFGGTYAEEAVGVPVQLTHEFSFVIPAFQSGASATVTISPISSIVRSLAKAAIARGSSLSDAVSVAWTHCNNHFGGIDWRSANPTSLTPSQKTTVTMSDATTAGLILAGISQAARTMAEASSLSPGTSVTGGTVSGAGADDAADGTLDGMAGGVALVQGSAALTTYTFRRALGQAIVKFVGTSYNNTQLTAADVMSLANALAADSDPYLFCLNQTAAPGCAGGSLQLQPPTITFVSPPAFVGTTTVTLNVTAADPIAPVTAVYAQTVAGAQVMGSLSAGVWTLSDIPVVEGPNVIYVWAVDAAGTGSIASASQITVTRDTLPVSPYVNTAAVSYYDERPMTLANGSVPATYVLPSSATKVSPLVAGSVYKAATRLSWITQPTATILESANPDNIPFVQFALPVSPTRAPTSSATYSVGDGNTTFTGDLMPWKSPASTSSVEYYDLPLSANIISTLATTAASSLTLAIQGTFTNAVGTSGSASTSVPFAVIGPPLFVSEDTAYSTYNDLRSTFPYKLANNAYATLFNPGASAFVNGQVRLLRYIVSNPTPLSIALRTDVQQSASGSWVGTESWDGTRSRLTARNPVSISNCVCFWSCNSWTPTVIPSMDGFTFGDCIENVGDTCAPTPEWQPVPPTAANIIGWYTHIAGDTATKFACKPKLWYGGTRTISSADVAAQVFVGPAPSAGEVTPPNSVGAFSVVPAATGSAPGTLVVYVSRPVSAARTVPLGTWNQFTGSNRYEVNEGYVYIPDSYDTSTGSYVWWFGGSGTNGWVGEAAAYQEIGFLSAASESLSASLALTTQGLSGTSLIGGPASMAPIAFSRSQLTTH
jgi:hypothetical protein